MGSISEYAVAARRTPRARALTIGFVIAGGYVMAYTGDVGWRRLAITGAAAALMLRTRDQSTLGFDRKRNLGRIRCPLIHRHWVEQ
jgi:hypothetical protein